MQQCHKPYMCEFDKGTKYTGGDYDCGMWPFSGNGCKITLMSVRSDESSTVSTGDGYWHIDRAHYKASWRVLQKEASLSEETGQEFTIEWSFTQMMAGKRTQLNVSDIVKPFGKS